MTYWMQLNMAGHLRYSLWGQAAKEVLLLMTWIARKNGESFAKALKEDLATRQSGIPIIKL